MVKRYRIRQKASDEKGARVSPRFLAVVAITLAFPLWLLAEAPLPLNKPAHYPGWWFEREVIPRLNTNLTTNSGWPTNYPPANDYAAINQGQLKFIALKAVDELRARLPGEVGTNIAALTNNFSITNGNYNAVNLGQLKTVAKPFYERLIEVHYTTNFPWAGSTNTNDYAVVNIGQAKNLFSFDLTAAPGELPEWWQSYYLGQIGVDPNGNADGDEFTNLQEFQNGTNPADYPSALYPNIAIVSGDDQISGPNQFLARPLIVRATDVGGAPLSGIRLNFHGYDSAGKVASISVGGPILYSNLTVVTGTNGLAQVYFMLPAVPSGLHQIAVTLPTDTSTPLVLFSAISQGNWLDSDGDSLSDEWEEDHHFDPGDPSDANLDFDGDGISNYAEFQAGSDPEDYYNGASPAPVLKIKTIGNAEAKCGYEQFVITDPPAIKIYHKKKVEDIFAISFTVSVNCSYPVTLDDEEIFIGENTINDSETHTQSGGITRTYAKNIETCEEGAIACVGEIVTVQDQTIFHTFPIDSDEDHSGTVTTIENCLDGDVVYTGDYISLAVINGFTYQTELPAPSSLMKTEIRTYSPNVYESDLCPPSVTIGGDTETITTTLSDLYTNDELINFTISKLPSWPEPYAGPGFSAYRNLSDTQIGFTVRKMRYKFTFEKTHPFTIRWRVKFAPENGDAPTYTYKTYDAQGDEGETPEFYEIDPTNGPDGTYTVEQFYVDLDAEGSDENTEETIPDGPLTEESPGTLLAYGTGLAGATRVLTWSGDFIVMTDLGEIIESGYVINNDAAVWFMVYANPEAENHDQPFTATVTAHSQEGADLGTDNITLYPSNIAVDANRDGAIQFVGPPSDPATVGESEDATSEEKPFKFWVNDDRDGNSAVSDETDVQDDLEPSAGTRDCNDASIGCQRDLEDFARIWIQTKGLNQELHDGKLKLGLEWATTGSAPQIGIYASSELDGGTKYLTDKTTGQINAPYKTRMSVIKGNTPYIFPKSFWANATGDGATIHLLFEGIKRGKGRLVVSFYESNGKTKIREGASVYLDLKNIKECYERWTVGEGNGGVPSESAELSTQRLPTGIGGLEYDVDHPGLSVPSDANGNKYILFVHGWNTPPWEKDAFAETMFKRLYWHGYRGKFGVFQWPTTYNNYYSVQSLSTYDDGEFTAWLSAVPLKAKLSALSSKYEGELCVLAHSMGNIVAGEALRLSAQSSSGQLVNTYIASQAAVPAHCYDSTLLANNMLVYSSLQGPHTPNIYNNWLASGSVRVRANFYNVNDFALNEMHWQLDQKLKPDYRYPYVYYYSSFDLATPQDFFKISFCPDATKAPLVIQGHTGFFPTQLHLGSPANVLDRYKIMAYASEPLSKALGSSTEADGFVLQNLQDEEVWPSDSLGHTYEEHKWHSAQFRFTNADQSKYWKTILGPKGFDLSP